MSFIADLTKARELTGKVVGNGHCVPFVRAVSPAPHTSRWAPGDKVRGGEVGTGTVIATFDPRTGTYENDVSGRARSHAAVFLDELPEGLRVIDQWVGRPVGERTIRFKGGSQPHADDGDTYWVVEEALGAG